jgi:hypothetical protein
MERISDKQMRRIVSVALLIIASITLIGLQLKPWGWGILALSLLSLVLADRKFAKDMLLINLSLAVLGVTEISTDISYPHMLIMTLMLGSVLIIPYLVSRYVYGDYTIRFPFHHGRRWYKTEVAYIGFAALASYLILPIYMSTTGAYQNWPAASDSASLTRLFIGTSGLGIWDELFFIGVVLTLLRNYFPFMWANLIQAVLWTSFLYELGFIGWGPIAIFLFALLQGYIFNKTHSLIYIITIHLTLDFFLFLAIVNSHNPRMFNIFL